MARFHINPKTGNPGKCSATKSCPFGDISEEHYDSPERARSAYEAKQRAFEKAVKEVPHVLPLDEDTTLLLARLSEAGITPLVVGGAVRDSLASDLVPKDVDIEAYGIESMDELLAIVKVHKYRVDEVGKSFGVLKIVLQNGMDVDLSLPRRDSLIGEGHRGFDVVVDTNLTLSEAAARRDFTINALYYDHKRGMILDAHGGLADWDAKRLRHVSDAFSEDPLRVLRAVQFASRFGFHLAPETADEARRISDKFDSLSTERVQAEWSKLFLKGKSLEHGLETLHATGWDRHFGLDKVDRVQAAKNADDAMATAKAGGLRHEVYAAGALAKHLPVEERKRFLQQTVIGEREANKVLRLGQVEEPEVFTSREVSRWARNEVKSNSGSVKEWDAVNGPFMLSGIRERIAETAKVNGSWDAPKPDFISGQMILDGVGTKQGGSWVGEIQKEAAAAQDEERFLSGASAQAWLAARLDGFTVPDFPKKRK